MGDSDHLVGGATMITFYKPVSDSMVDRVNLCY